MSAVAETAEEAIERLKHFDPMLKNISLYSKEYIDLELAELVDCLLAHPNVVMDVNLDDNRLTDETGVKLARYVTASSTVEYLSLYGNQLGSATYLALAAALRVNTSLRCLYLVGNEAEDKSCIDAALVEALRLNPNRPADSAWCLNYWSNDFQRIRAEAEQQGHPSLQMLLVDQC